VITLSETKLYLGISGTTYDTSLTFLISASESAIETYLDRPVDAVTITGEVLKFETSQWEARPVPVIDMATSKQTAQTFQYPVVSGTVFYDGVALDADNYRIDATSGVIEFDRYYSDRENLLTINYTGGFVTAPDDLKYVALEGVKQMFIASNAVTPGAGGEIKSEKIGDYSVTYQDTLGSVAGSTLPRWVAANSFILDKYKRKYV
jgi:hypothetical protein